MPASADTIVIQEHTARAGDVDIVPKPRGPGRHLRAEGLDFRAGEFLLAAGHRLTARDLALAAAMNRPTVPVHRRAKVAILATGDELVMPGTTPATARSSIPTALRSPRRSAEGAEVIDLGILPDRLDATIAAVRRACEFAVDDAGDHRRRLGRRPRPGAEAFTAEGMVLSFWKIAMRPGRPLMHGRLFENIDVLGLPGNPVSAFVCGVLFLVPLLRRLAGTTRSPVPVQIGDSRSRPAGERRAGRLFALRARNPRRRNRGRNAVSGQDSSMLAPLAKGRLPRDWETPRLRQNRAAVAPS